MSGICNGDWKNCHRGFCIVNNECMNNAAAMPAQRPQPACCAYCGTEITNAQGVARKCCREGHDFDVERGFQPSLPVDVVKPGQIDGHGSLKQGDIAEMYHEGTKSFYDVRVICQRVQQPLPRLSGKEERAILAEISAPDAEDSTFQGRTGIAENPALREYNFLNQIVPKLVGKKILGFQLRPLADQPTHLVLYLESDKGTIELTVLFEGLTLSG